MGGNGAGGGSIKNQLPSTDVWQFQICARLFMCNSLSPPGGRKLT